MGRLSKRDALLDAAAALVQTVGYNAFSYRDLADRVGIKTASIHYHFPTKGDLGQALMARYRTSFRAHLDDIDRAERDAGGRLRGLVAAFRETLVGQERMCMCGMLSSESATLPTAIRAEIAGFFDDTETWVKTVLRDGRQDGNLRVAGEVEVAARTFVAALEGAMLSAYALGDVCRFDDSAGWLLSCLGTEASEPT